MSSDIFVQKFRWQDIATISDSELSSYGPGADYYYPDGYILKGSSAALYLISYGQKGVFTSGDAYISRGYTWSQFITVPDEVLTHYADGLSLD